MFVLRRSCRLTAATLALAGVAILPARSALAGPLDLEDDDDKKSDKRDEKPVDKNEPVVGAAPIATIKMHSYTLAECLALADRNHPNLWAARARLGAVHAQLDEAKYTPYSYWSASSTFGVLPTIGGTPFYNAVPRSVLNQGIGDSYQPFLQFSIRGTVPIYTFGKIESI